VEILSLREGFMDQTPAHEQHNPHLLSLMPPAARTIVEVGCSSGALAREYKKINPTCRYIGVELSPQCAALAKRYCDVVHELDMEAAAEDFMRGSLAGDCCVFGDSLEHLRDPWALLATIRRFIPTDGCIVACIPNVQHWSVQARLNCGEFRYEDSGLLDRTHLRWFTRRTMLDLFQQTGFRVVAGIPRIFSHPSRDQVLSGIKLMAQAIGADPELAAQEALPTQYVLRAIPA
jgi:SAM-dependent methyltransferase